MAKQPGPWYWQERRAWYVTMGGKRHPLGPHPEDAPAPQKSKKTGRWNVPGAIADAFHNLMTRGSPDSEAVGPLVVDVLQSFLSWCKENRADRTRRRYFDFLDAFERRYPGLRVSCLHAGHVTDWLSEQKGWGPTTKRNAIVALQRAFNWACKNKGLSRNPIRGMEKPKARTRTEIVTPEEFEQLLTHALPEFRDLLVVSYDSGARPFEIKELQKRHCQLDKNRAVLPADEAKGRKRTRAFYFPTERSMDVLKRRCAEHPEGPLFRNRRGNKWTGFAVKCAFARLDAVLGRRITHYALRHAFVTRKLVAGVDSHVVAALSGHRDTSMIDRCYSHVAEDHEFMLKQAQKDIAAKRP